MSVLRYPRRQSQHYERIPRTGQLPAEQTNQNVRQILHVAFTDTINWVCALGTVELSINRAATVSGFLPHYLNLGYEPTLLPDVEHSDVVDNAINESIGAFLHRMREDWESACAAYNVAGEKGIAPANRHRRKAQFAVGDWVLLQMFPKPVGPALATITSCLRASLVRAKSEL